MHTPMFALDRPADLLSRIDLVPPPPGPVYRVGRAGADLWAPRDWARASPLDGMFGNRFDDPSFSYIPSTPPEGRFRVIYCATRLAGAIAETAAPLRRALQDQQAVYSEVPGVDEPTNHLPSQRSQPPVLDIRWRSGRQVARAILEPSDKFIDLTGSRTIQYLRGIPLFKRLALEHGFGDVSQSFLTTTKRHITCAISYLFYHQTAPFVPPPAGIRYTSQYPGDWECWAVYSNRLNCTPLDPIPIDADDPEVREGADTLGLRIQLDDGRIVMP